MENKVVVKIYGEDYPITGVSDPSYISRIADFLDSRMNDVARSSPVKSRDKVAILTAMSLASELYEKKTRLETQDRDLDARIESVLTRLDDALAING
jgi:cell division protein ZapA